MVAMATEPEQTATIETGKKSLDQGHINAQRGNRLPRRERAAQNREETTKTRHNARHSKSKDLGKKKKKVTSFLSQDITRLGSGSEITGWVGTFPKRWDGNNRDKGGGGGKGATYRIGTRTTVLFPFWDAVWVL